MAPAVVPWGPTAPQQGLSGAGADSRAVWQEGRPQLEVTALTVPCPVLWQEAPCAVPCTHHCHCVPSPKALFPRTPASKL